jgi:hypothetical protein
MPKIKYYTPEEAEKKGYISLTNSIYKDLKERTKLMCDPVDLYNIYHGQLERLARKEIKGVMMVKLKTKFGGHTIYDTYEVWIKEKKSRRIF